ncbi:hypothetical protein D3C75_938230 [compost metagenome]
MSQCIIDFLETVEIKKEQRVGLCRLCRLQKAFELVHKIQPVGYFRQAVVMRELFIQTLGHAEITCADADHPFQFTVEAALMPEDVENERNDKQDGNIDP